MTSDSSLLPATLDFEDADGRKIGLYVWLVLHKRLFLAVSRLWGINTSITELCEGETESAEGSAWKAKIVYSSAIHGKQAMETVTGPEIKTTVSSRFRTHHTKNRGDEQHCSRQGNFIYQQAEFAPCQVMTSY